MPIPRFPAVCLTIGLILTLTPHGVVIAGAPKPYHISGARKDPDGKWKEVPIVRQAQQGLSFEIEYLKPEAARHTLGASLKRDVDLLPGRVDERRPGFLVFVLQVTNGTAVDVLFNPGQARLSTEKGDMNFAADYSALYDISRRLGADAPTLEELAAAIFDRDVTIKPGGSVRKLLVFEAPVEDRYKTIEVRLAEINVGLGSLDAVFAFRKFFEEPAAAR